MTSFKAAHHESNGQHELLLAHRGWVSDLARQLVSDPFGAEDVAQETFLAALKAPPRGAGDPRVLRAWLTRVARNLANLAMRRTDRLRARESEAARDERVASAAETVERASQHGRVVEAVLSLPEPYRATLLLRYFEGESYANIATSFGITEVAVRKRLSRGHQKLRAALEREYGSAQAWMAALLPLLARKSGTLVLKNAPLSASTPLHVPLLAGGLVAASGLIGVAALVFNAPEEERAQAALESSTKVVAHAPEDLYEPSYERRAVGLPGWTDAGLDDPRPSSSVRGQVIDPAGNPLGGLELFVEDLENGPLQPVGLSEEDGSFELELAEGDVHLLARGPRHATVRKSYVGDPGFASLHVIVAAPLVDIGGRVVDAWGAPIEGATVELFVADEAFSSLEIPLDRTEDVGYSSSSSSRGEFELRAIPSASGLHLCASARGWELALVQVPEFSTARLEIVLDRPLLLAGRSAIPASAADLHEAVKLSSASWCSPEGATFSSRLDGWTDVAREHPTQARTRSPSASELLSWNTEREPADGEGRALIEGRLLGPGGKPLVNWLVRARDPGQIDAFMVDAALGRMACSRTDALGRFAFTAEAGEVELQAYDPKTLQSVRSDLPREVLGGDDMVVHVDAMTSRSVSGRVLSTVGVPLPRVRVRATRVFAGSGRLWREHGAEASTDASGFFVLREVPLEPIELLVDYENVLPVLHSVPMDVEEVEIEVSQNAYMRFEGGGPFDGIGALDGSGRELAMASSQRPLERVRLLSDGRSPILAVSSEIRTLVLFRGDVEVGRIPVDAFPGSFVEVGR